MRLDAVLKLAQLVLVAKSSQVAGKEIFRNAASYVVVLLVGMVVSLVALMMAVGLGVAALIGMAFGFPTPILLTMGGTALAMVAIAGMAWYALVRAKKVSEKVQDMMKSESVFEDSKALHDPIQMGKEVIESLVPDEVLKWRDAFTRGWEKGAHEPSSRH